MPFKVQGNVSGNVAEVDANHNLQVNLPTDPNTAGYTRILNSDGGPLDSTENGYLRVSSANPVLFEQVDGAVLNTNVWATALTTYTAAQAGGFITLNSGASVATGASGILTSIKAIPLYGTLPMIFTANAKTSNLPAANATCELGLGAASGTTAPTDGCFFRWTPAGQFMAIVNNNGSETSAGPLTGTFTDTTGKQVTVPPSNTTIHLYEIEMVEDHVLFYVDDAQVANIQTPAGLAYPTNNGRQTVLARVYSGGSAPSLAPQLSLGQVNCTQEDLNANKPWAETLVMLGRGAYQSPVTAFAQTASHANSAGPVSAALSNTVPAYTTLGGRYQFAAVAGATTDYAVFGYQVPANYQLVIAGVRISALNVGAAVGATASVMEWSLGLNASAASLATTDGASTWAPRRVSLGMQSLAALGGIGLACADIDVRFTVPLVVDGGRYLHLIMQMPVGLATGSQIIRGQVMVNGFFE